MRLTRASCKRVSAIFFNSRPVAGASAGADDVAEYEEEPLGALDMNKITLVETTRTSEHGQKDLRLVDEDGQVLTAAFLEM
jgi:hypothetical protein